MWSQTIYFIMDKDMGPIESMKASVNVMKGNKINFFLLGLLMFVAGMVIIVCTCGVGIFIISPCFFLILACVYVTISGSNKISEPEVSEAPEAAE